MALARITASVGGRRLTSAAAACGAAILAGVATVLVPLALVGLVMIAGAAAVATAPAVGLLLVSALAAATLLSEQSGTLALAAAAMSGAVAILALRGARRTGDSPTPALLAVLATYLLVSLLIAAASRGGEVDFAQVGAVVGLVLMPYSLAFGMSRAKPILDRLILGFLGISVALGAVHLLTSPVLGLLQAPLAVDIGAAMTQNRNVAGAVYLLGLAVAVPRVRSPRRWLAAAATVSVIILSSAVAISLSRSSYAGAVAFVPILLMLRGPRLGRIAGLGIAGLAIAFLGSSGPIDAAIDRATATIAGGTLDSSAAARIDLWFAAIRGFEQNPIFGLGFHNFAPNLGALWSGSLSDLAIHSQASTFIYAHNLYLTILSQAGLLGVALFVLVVVSMGRDAQRASDTERQTGLLALGSIGVACLFGEPLFALAVTVPFLLINADARASVIQR
ncbi:MAG TPA: O-antigen ligase family protein [Candidatus Limnocylindrales bacterium]|nr:O-antigen ligase family protein [Candidatus Limnocylindrales bacterium]